MIRVFVEVCEEAAPLRLEVLAESISLAVSSVEELYPGRAVQVVFPIDPDEFFVGGSLDTQSSAREVQTTRM